MPAVEHDALRVSGLTLRHALQTAGAGTLTLLSRTPLEPEFLRQLETRISALAGRPQSLEFRVDPRLTSGAALLVGADTRIDLDPGLRLLRAVAEAGGGPPRPTDTLADASRRLSQLLATTEPGPAVEDVAGWGTVRQVGDGVAIVSGLTGVTSQEVIRFENGVEGIAFNLLQDAVGCLLLGPEQSIQEGSSVSRTGQVLRVPVGEALLGRIVNALGQPLDGGAPIPRDTLRPIEARAPGVVERQPVSESLHSGIKVLDALVPLGRGQRELILGDRKIGKTTVALDVILSQAGTGVVCVYASIGQKASSLAEVIDLLSERGAMDYTVVVAALPGEPPAFRHIAPYAACTIAEEVMRQGRHALVVFDDLSKHAVTYREISALLKRPIGREAYPGDIFYAHSRLLERAARLRDDLGGGSLTALPIVETISGDISALIPTNVISICDGQIVLDRALFNAGVRPAMDAGLSVSRVGGMAQTPAMRKVAGRLRLDLAQYQEMARFVKFGAEVDQATLDQLRRGERELELLKQDAHVPLSLAREVVILHAAVEGFTDAIAVGQLGRYEAELQAFLDREQPDLLAGIGESRDLPAELTARLEQALAAFGAEFRAAHPDALEGHAP